MNILVLIPARYASTRFPGKPLAIIKGKPMIQRVYEQALKAYENVCVATDNQSIYDKVIEFGGEVVMTSSEHKSGTDRCLEALKNYSLQTGKNFDSVINVQGDEPFIHPEQIRLIGNLLINKDVQIATLIKHINCIEEFNNHNSPKVIVDKCGNALYFSRASIPFPTNKDINKDMLKTGPFYRHIGMYGYKTEILEAICKIPQSSLELYEKLEQLRWLENGYRISTAVTDYETHAVDTPEDLIFLNNNSVY